MNEQLEIQYVLQLIEITDRILSTCKDELSQLNEFVNDIMSIAFLIKGDSEDYFNVEDDELFNNNVHLLLKGQIVNPITNKKYSKGINGIKEILNQYQLLIKECIFYNEAISDLDLNLNSKIKIEQIDFPIDAQDSQLELLTHKLILRDKPRLPKKLRKRKHKKRLPISEIDRFLLRKPTVYQPFLIKLDNPLDLNIVFNVLNDLICGDQEIKAFFVVVNDLVLTTLQNINFRNEFKPVDNNILIETMDCLKEIKGLLDTDPVLKYRLLFLLKLVQNSI